MNVTVFVPWNQDRRLPVFKEHLTVEEVTAAVMRYYGYITKSISVKSEGPYHYVVSLDDHPDIGWDVYLEYTAK